MRLTSIAIKGFRGYREEVTVELEDFSVLIGRNDAGKSTIFAALTMFLESGKPDQADYAVGGDGVIAITCAFEDLPSAIVIDESASTSLDSEHLLGFDGRLTISKRWTLGRTAVEVAAIADHPVVEGEEPLIGLKQAQLKQLAVDLDILDKVEDRRVNAAYRRAIWAEWADRGTSINKRIEVQLNAEDGKQVAHEIQSYFPMFQLFEADRSGTESDQVAQDPAKAIVKSVLERHSQQLAELSEVIGAEIAQHLEEVVEKLSEFAPDLASELRPRDIDPGWQKAFGAVQFVDGSGVSLAKRGSGTRRLVLLSFFRAEAESKHAGESSAGRRGLILAVEEPETALHPDMQREALRTLMDVAALPGRQVFITTHSTNLVREVPLTSIRYISRDDGGARYCASAKTVGDAGFLAALSKSMGAFSDHNVRVFAIVEGRNDIDGLLTLSKALVNHGIDDVTDFGVAEIAGTLCLIPIGGCGAAALWESRLAGFDRPERHLLDSDKTTLDEPLSSEKRAYVSRFDSNSDERVHVRVLVRRELENYLTVDAVVDALQPLYGHQFDVLFRARVASLDWDYLDVPEMCAVVAHETLNLASSKPWHELDEKTRGQKESKAKKQLVRAFAHESVARSLSNSGNDLLEELRALSAMLTTA